MKSPVPLDRLKLRGVVRDGFRRRGGAIGCTEPAFKHEIFLSVAFEIDDGNWFMMLY